MTAPTDKEITLPVAIEYTRNSCALVGLVALLTDCRLVINWFGANFDIFPGDFLRLLALIIWGCYFIHWSKSRQQE